jgi:hypothetical protein
MTPCNVPFDQQPSEGIGVCASEIVTRGVADFEGLRIRIGIREASGETEGQDGEIIESVALVARNEFGDPVSVQ